MYSTVRLVQIFNMLAIAVAVMRRQSTTFSTSKVAELFWHTAAKATSVSNTFPFKYSLSRWGQWVARAITLRSVSAVQPAMSTMESDVQRCANPNTASSVIPVWSERLMSLRWGQLCAIPSTIASVKLPQLELNQQCCEGYQ